MHVGEKTYAKTWLGTRRKSKGWRGGPSTLILRQQELCDLKDSNTLALGHDR